ncbi:Sedoheptulose 1,7-bisphosphatase [Coniosporium apollinis]|uniref:Sedoheptulose 1,7-bisphosphatase n=2 Tax=Coniosporium TaxID=2810619 RepID=A0ABQ9NZH7_9PEZI|nr:Sedoheptulose 1,7-bisphosphatase [Cladosporium sp. JES 115]KAJ9666715.1 Sedoheptulose 1,7-bisphosphatase [Coniosporium apollinis]
MTTPRAFVVRHGETEWSLNGRHTGVTELPLTENGEKRIRATGQALVGDDRLIVPSNLAHIYVSPRKRAQRTLELLNLGCKDPMPWQKDQHYESAHPRTNAKITVTEDIREWDYGDYEGLTSATIREERRKKGENPNWNIWSDGCPGGESPQQIMERLDRIIKEIREKYHGPACGKKVGEAPPCDVLLVAHGHILRAFAARWIGEDISSNPALILEAGGVGTVSYEHHSIDEPAILLGGAFMVNVVENAAEEKKG